MLLAIDIGNTRIKYAVFEDDSLLIESFCTHNDLQQSIKNLLVNFPQITHFLISAVGTFDKTQLNIFEKRYLIHFISHRDSFPFQNQYATPTTLGIDRLVLASGAVLQYPKQNRLVIDTGTCITYDFIDSADNYLGGAISPGIRLRYESLHNFTSKLPLLSKSQPSDFIGNSTVESIHSGVVNGLVNEIDGFIDQYRERYTKFIIILTGGDTEFLAKRLKNTIFAHSNFLLESLNQTFQYTYKK